MKGRILLDSKIVMSDLDIDVHVVTRGGLQEWSGSFSVDNSSMLSYDKYQLELADGRSGHIHISGKGTISGASTITVRFIGTGPLKRSEED